MNKNNFFLKIINFFKKLFKIDNNNLLSEASRDKEYINNKDIHQQNQYTQTNITNSNSTPLSRKEVPVRHNSFNIPNDENSVNPSNKRNSDKNITMFLYKQVRLGNLDPKYIPDQYLERVATLLKEENRIKKRQIDRLNKEIEQTKTTINNLS